MLSIVMPVYNAEKDLPLILEDLFTCPDQDMEVICVNDGSSDRSGKVLDQFAQKDTRLKVIHQANAGMSRAINRGLDAASGEYVWIIDDDDRIEIETLRHVHELLDKDQDIINFGLTLDFTEEKYAITRTLPTHAYTRTIDAVHDFLGNDSFNQYWNKIYKRSVIAGIRQKMNADDMAGDFILNCYAFAHSKKILNCQEILYHYQKRSNETMVTRYVRNSRSSLEAKEDALRYMMEQLNAPKDPVIDDYLLREYEVFVINLTSKECPYTSQQKKDLIDKLILNEKAFQTILNARPSNRYASIFKSIASKGNASYLLRSYQVLAKAKDTAGPLYRAFRKASYQSEEKA